MSSSRIRFVLIFAVAIASLPFPRTELSAQRCNGVRYERVALIAGGFAAVQGVGLALRHNDWWPGPSSGFTVAWDDVSASKSQDRLLHASIAYQLSQGGALAFDWACVSHKTSGWLGAALGVAFSLPKEIGDGFQEDKGFSMPDMAWTTAGALLPALHRSWPASRVVGLKAFYWPSSEFRNSGSDLPDLENDYAGQRFYLAIDPGLLDSGAGPWPDWLGVAVGHSVPHWYSAPPHHEWYFTLDLNARGLPIQAVWWYDVASLLDQWHFPMPGVRIRDGEVSLGFY